MRSHRPYRGDKRKLVLAFEVGTTHSAISYCILNPGQAPKIKTVSSFPGHQAVEGSFRIPTIIYYDRSGNVKAAGAEAVREGIYEEAEDGEWIKAEWFKLHLGAWPRARNVAAEIPPLPLGKTAVAVLSDFYAYLLTCALNHIRDTHTNDPDLWLLPKDDIEFVITHPNGWEGEPQSALRSAAVLAKLIPDTSAGHGRLSFVTEGEVNLYTALPELPGASINQGDGVVVVAAGSSTIDVASYSKITGNREGKGGYEEVASPQCHSKGYAFVSIHAKLFLENLLQDSPFLDDLDHIIRCFDQTTKVRFRNADQPQYIKFGSTRDNDPSRNIRFGQLKLSGADVASFFQPSIDCIVKAVLDQRVAHERILHVVLVGEFSTNDWIFVSVLKKLSPLGFFVIRPSVHASRTIPDGAISFYLAHFMQRHSVSSDAADTQPKTQVPESKPATPVGPSSTLDGSGGLPARGMPLSEMLRRL